MEYSYKFRLYPNWEQENLILRTFGCCRFVFNHFLAQRQEQYRETGTSPTRFQQDKSLTMLKREVGRDTPEPIRSGRLCKTSHGAGYGQRTENPPALAVGSVNAEAVAEYEKR